MVTTNTADIGRAVKNIESSTVVLKSLLDDLRAGKGLAGSMIKNETMAANMSQIIDPYPPEKNPMPDFLRQLWAPVRAAVASAIDPILIAHRDFIFTQHLPLPLDF